VNFDAETGDRTNRTSITMHNTENEKAPSATV